MQDYETNTSHQETQPLVTFIVTYYNLPVPMLCECINSILALSLNPSEREIIVVDDGSDVSPMNGLMNYSDDIIYVRQKNAGLSMARNKGIEVATGRYIQFVDADDYLLKSAYDQCLDMVRSTSTADILMFDFATAPTSQTYSDKRLTLSGTDLLRHHNIHGTACGYLFKHAILGELRFTPGIFHEDEEFTPLLLIRAEQVIVTQLPAYYYRQRKDSITQSCSDANTHKRLNDFHDVIVRLHQYGDHLSQNDKLALQRRVAQLTMDYLYQVIMQMRSRQVLENRIATLRTEGLFPLPDYSYTQKYKWFRQLSATSIGRRMLTYTIPLMKHER